MNFEIKYVPSPYKGLVLDVKIDGQSVSEDAKIPTTSHLTIIVGEGEGEKEAENDSISVADDEDILFIIE